MSYSGTLDEILTPLGLKCSEEPMRESVPETEAYIVWRQLGRRLIFASGKAYGECAYAAVSLYWPMGGGWQRTADAIRARLKEAGAFGVRIAGDSWHDEIGRRVIVIYCYFRQGTEE